MVVSAPVVAADRQGRSPREIWPIGQFAIRSPLLTLTLRPPPAYPFVRSTETQQTSASGAPHAVHREGISWVGSWLGYG
jgi:hypothetical protein